MAKLTDLRVLFRVVAVLEAAYFAAAMLPPSLIEPATGWVLGPDGQWMVKLIGLALLTQAAVAWVFRDEPHRGVGTVLAGYQFASATMDWVMWLVLFDDGVFSSVQARVGVIGAIVSHYAVGTLLVLALRRDRGASTPTAVPASDGATARHPG